MKTKIRFLINTLSGGGAERVLVDLLNQLDTDIYDIELMTVTGGIYETQISKKIKHKKIAHCKNKKIEDVISKIVLKLPSWLFAKIFLRGSFDFDVAYLEGIPTRFMARKTGNGAKYAFVHCDLSKINFIAPFYKNNEEILKEYRGFTRVCFVSDSARVGFQTAIGELENSCVVHNVINAQKIISMSQELNDEEYRTDGLKIVTVGRLVEAKGYDRLLRIISDLEKEYNLELWIIGDGNDRKKLEKIIEEKDIKSVKLMGFKENPYSYMKKADLFVCSSFSEGYSTAVSEAVVMGIPVITTRCAGMDEILNNGEYGLIVENSEEDLKNAMESLLKDNTFCSQILSRCCRASDFTKSKTQILTEYNDLFSI